MMSFLSRLFGKVPAATASEPIVTAPMPTATAAGQTADRTRAAVQAAQEEEVLQNAIRAQDAATLARLVVSGLSTKVRQRAAQAIEDPTLLRQLIRDVRGGNDKSVYRILTTRRDAMLAQTRQLEALQAEVAAAAAALERHSRRTYDPLFAPTLEQLEVRWQGVSAHADPDTSSRTQQSIDQAREVIAQHLREIASKASAQLAAQNVATEARRVRDEQIKAAAAAAAERSRGDDEERRAAAEQRESQAMARRQLGGLVRKAQAALDEGSTGRAAGLRRALDEKLAGVPILPGYLTSQIQKLDERLQELKDWKNFSVAPKRIELIEEMESLLQSTLDPPLLADRIKSLQEEWRTLSRGAGENLETDWQRFHEAAQKAYQPCREYFEAQSVLRNENLQRRQALVERLAAFEAGHDWTQPDWPLVLRALRESRQQWRQHSPVERAAGKALLVDFNTVFAKLQDRLNAQYSRNGAQMQQLIARAQQLLGLEDSRQAIQEVKELQNRWRAVGPVAREEGHRLWDEFRQQCDAVFQRRQQEFAEYAAAQEASRDQAIALCEQLEQVASLTGRELVQAAEALPAVQTQFQELGEFPRNVSREINNRFERAVERCEQALQQQLVRDRERSWTDLLTASSYVRAWQLAVVRGAAVTEVDELLRLAQQYVASVAVWPRGGLDILQRQFATPGVHAADTALIEEQLVANEKALRLLCVRAEIAADRPTPLEDQDLRRKYQVQRLVQGMGQGIVREAGELDSLALQWTGVGPVESAIGERLLDRFKQSRRQ